MGRMYEIHRDKEYKHNNEQEERAGDGEIMRVIHINQQSP